MREKLFGRLLLLPGQALFSSATMLSVALIMNREQNMLCWTVPIACSLAICVAGAFRREFSALCVLALTILTAVIVIKDPYGDKLLPIALIVSALGCGLCSLLKGVSLGLTVIAAVLGTITALPFFIAHDNTTAVITAGIAVLWLALVYNADISQEKSSSLETFSGNNLLKTLIGLICVPALIVSAAAIATVSMNVYPQGQIQRDIGRQFTGFKDIGEAFSDFSISRLGYPIYSNRMGGPANLSLDQTYRIESDIRTSLRCQVFTEYTGQTWTRPKSFYNYPLDYIWSKAEQNELFDAKRPDRSKIPVSFFKSYSMNIYQIDDQTAIPIPFRFDSVVMIDKKEKNDLIFNSMGDIFLKNKGYCPVKISGSIPDVNHPDFVKWMSQYSDGMSEDTNHIESIRETYLQLPSSLPDSVKETAAEVSGAGTSFEQAKAVERWLAETKAYTLDPKTPPGDRDFVDYFLETNKGYCVYFATAMTVMCRSQGIPARYVTGYAMPAPGDNGSFILSGEDAHAWCEVYFEGIGWIPFEPTPGRSANANPFADLREPETEPDYQPGSTPDNTDPAEGNPVPPTSPVTLPPELQDNDPVENINPADTPADSRSWFSLVVTIVLIFLLSAATVQILILRIKHVCRTDKRLRDWYAIERALALMGFERTHSEPFTKYACRVEKQFPEANELGIATSAVYAEAILFHPSSGRVSVIKETKVKVEDLLRKKSLIKWIWFKITG